jgi:hypothetical protein
MIVSVVQKIGLVIVVPALFCFRTLFDELAGQVGLVLGEYSPRYGNWRCHDLVGYNVRIPVEADNLKRHVRFFHTRRIVFVTNKIPLNAPVCHKYCRLSWDIATLGA